MCCKRVGTAGHCSVAQHYALRLAAPVGCSCNAMSLLLPPMDHLMKAAESGLCSEEESGLCAMLKNHVTSEVRDVQYCHDIA